MSLPAPPVGTVTFLFTDIEGSTRLWEQSPDVMRLALARHDALLRQVIQENHGHLFKTMGDAFCVAFATAGEAIAAALSAQQKLVAEPWPKATPICVRMALYTGVAETRDGDYFGPALNRVARLLAVGHGGQTLLSQTVYDWIADALPSEITLLDLGEHRLKDLARAERIYQVVHPALASDFPPLRSLDHPELPNNLPHQMTSYIGREKETAEVHRLLEAGRLLTLTGSGGVGKTRLALQAAADALESFPQGVWFIELAALTEAHRVPQTVATILQVREEANRPLLQTLTEYCREKRLLLVLDNCEHLIETCAELADTLLRSCPELKILATSREALAIAGEQTYRVPSLSLPDPKLTAGITPERLSEYEAVRLFLERARLTRADFLMTATNAPAIASLCQRLDGIPLALELAAARIRSLSVEEIDTRLNNVFRLLTGGSRTALPRQQTLRAAIDWSYNLLAPAEQTLFRRLAVFHGGWTLEAAENVVAFATDRTETLEEAEILDLLTTLCDRSLVVAEVRGGATRYRLLDIVRQYAAEKATDTDEGLRCAERHLDWFARWTEAATPHLMGPEIGLWLDRLEADHENLRAALNHSVSKTEPAHAEIGLRLAGALVRFWSVRGYPGEGREHLRRALDATPNTPTKSRANALNGAGNLAYQMGDYVQARTYHQACLEIREQIGDRVGVAGSLNNLGNVAHDVGEYAEAKSLLERSLEINRALGDQRWQAYNLNGLGSVLSGMENQEAARDCFAQAVAAAQAVGDRFVETNALANLGMMQRFLGDLEAARWSLEAALSRTDELGYRGMEPTLWSELGWIARKQRDWERAAKWYQKALKAALEQGLKPQIIAALENIAFVLAEQKHENEAVPLFGFVAKERERLGIPQIPLDVPEYEQYYSRLQNALSAEVWQTLWNRGQALLLSEAVEIAIL